MALYIFVLLEMNFSFAHKLTY